MLQIFWRVGLMLSRQQKSQSNYNDNNKEDETFGGNRFMA